MAEISLKPHEPHGCPGNDVVGTRPTRRSTSVGSESRASVTMVARDKMGHKVRWALLAREQVSQ